MKISKIVFVCILSAFFLYIQSYQNISAEREIDNSDSPFGLDYIYPYIPFCQNEKLPRLFKDAGLGWVNFSDISWAKIEPKAPAGEKHNYKWETLDKMVRLWQSYGFHIVMTIKCGSVWAGGEITSGVLTKAKGPLKILLKNRWAKKVDRLPSPEHMQDYRDYIKAFIERYDGDGVNDMPGLLFPVLHYQIGNEYVHAGFWGGTLEDYGVLLKETYSAAKEANKDTKIILAGITWNDLFYDDLEGQRLEEMIQKKIRSSNETIAKGWQKAYEFTLGELKFTDSYDIIDARGNGPFWQAWPGYTKWLNRELKNNNAEDKEIWDIESRSEPDMGYNKAMIFHQERVCENDDEILKQMKKVPVFNRKNNRLWQWYLAEQARQTVKVLISRLGAKTEKVFIGYPTDVDFSAIATLGVGGMAYIGMLDKNLKPKPNYYAYKQVVSKIDGFSDATYKIENNVWHYVFSSKDKKVHVIWLDSGIAPGPDRDLSEKKLTLSFTGSKIYVTSAVTSLADVNIEGQAYTLTDGKFSFTISETPIFIEEY